MRRTIGSSATGWLALIAVGGVLGLIAVAHWAAALLGGGPVLYGEGAVAHAGAILARGGDPYAAEAPGTFVAANYPPLAFAVAALGEALGPLAALRAASIAATLALAALIARRAGLGLRGVALGLAFLALFPVEIWGAAHKPDPLAVALVAFGVVLAGPSWSRAGAAGILGALAILAKPTAVLPLGAVLVYLLLREPVTGRRTLTIGALGLAVGIGVVVLRSGVSGPIKHIAERNALALSIDALVGIVVVALIAVSVPVLFGLRSSDGRLLAYIAGSIGVALLGAREGATINYLLDVSAAAMIAIAASSSARSAIAPLAIAAQLVVAVIVFRPFAADAVTGRWGDPGRVKIAAGLSREAAHLAEDSGVLIANRIEPQVDDLFLWARLVASGAVADEVTPLVRDGRFASVISEVDLSKLDAAPAYERQRWLAPLASAVLSAYRLEVVTAGAYRYVPSRAR